MLKLTPDDIRRLVSSIGAVLVVILLTIIVEGKISTSADGPSAVARLDAPSSAQVGDVVTVTVELCDVEGLYGASLEINFPAETVTVRDADPQTPEVEIVPGDCPQPDYVVANSVDNLSGSIVYAATQLQPSEPVTGNCAIAYFALEIHDLHAVPLSFESVLLSDRYGTSIPVETRGMTITVNEELFLYTYIPIVQTQ
ncbi:MAG: hypothetical protein JXA14_17125 [Anaerolineae bacterium]|nr:hypothetical protein [Anaerolineae bacterium]